MFYNRSYNRDYGIYFNTLANFFFDKYSKNLRLTRNFSSKIKVEGKLKGYPFLEVNIKGI